MNSTHSPTARVARRYIDGPYGQIHVRVATPEKNRHPALVMLHQSPGSSHVFDVIMRTLGAQRLIVAPDTPGFGMSDAPAEPPDIEQYASAVKAVLESFCLDQADVFGYHTGACTAVSLANSAPGRIRRLVLAGIPVFEDAEREAFFASPWPKPVAADGSHIAQEWQRSLQWRGPGQPVESLVNMFVAKLQAGETAWWGARAAFRFDMRSTLPRIDHPVLAINPKDDLWEITPRARVLLRNCQWLDLPHLGFGLFDAATDEIATAITGFLDGNRNGNAA